MGNWESLALWWLGHLGFANVWMGTIQMAGRVVGLVQQPKDRCQKAQKEMLGVWP